MDINTQTTGVQAAPDDTQSQTDTAPVQASEADVQVTSEAPEATQDTGETSPEIKAEDTAEERLYAGKYKTVEDMEKAYKSAENKLHTEAIEKAELARILNETFTTPEAQAPAQATDTDSYGDYEETTTVDPRIEAIERKEAVRDFVFTHPDTDGQAVNKILNSDPLVKNIQGYEAKLEYAYLKSRATAQPKAVADAEKRASEQTQAKIAEKQAAQVEGARQQAQPAGNNELSNSELRDTLRNDKAFDDLIQQRFPGISKMRTRT